MVGIFVDIKEDIQPKKIELEIIASRYETKEGLYQLTFDMSDEVAFSIVFDGIELKRLIKALQTIQKEEKGTEIVQMEK